MKEDFYYFIHKNLVTAGSKFPDKLPKISKVKRSKWPINAFFSDRNEAEGPFESLQILKENSFILAKIKIQKHRQRILKSNNITVVENFIYTDENDSYSFDYMSAFAHITIGKISNSNVKGIHFYNPNTVRIIEKRYIDSRTGCYSARIKKLNEQTGQWIEKESLSTFFSDNWDIDRLFYEFNYAFSNKYLSIGNAYHSMTSNNIKVEFIINQDDKILTCYPIVNTE
jgi:hypothetical protein